MKCHFSPGSIRVYTALITVLLVVFLHSVFGEKLQNCTCTDSAGAGEAGHIMVSKIKWRVVIQRHEDKRDHAEITHHFIFGN